MTESDEWEDQGPCWDADRYGHAVVVEAVDEILGGSAIRDSFLLSVQV